MKGSRVCFSRLASHTLALLPGAVGCVPDPGPAPDPRSSSSTASPLRFEPERALDRVDSTTWIVVERDEPSEPARRRPGLFEGRLSSTDRGRIERQDLSSTLVERQVPVHSWTDLDGTYVAPLAALTPGTLHTVVWDDGDVVGEFTVSEHPERSLVRVWPPQDQWGGVHAVYCGEVDVRNTPARISLAEHGLEALVTDADLTLGMPGCLHVQVPILPPAGYAVALPPRMLGVASPPTIVRVEAEVGGVGDGSDASVVCEEPSLPLLGACLRVHDDRFLVERRGPAQFWHVSSDAKTWNGVLGENDVAAFVGLQPDGTTELDVRVFEIDGRERSASIEVSTAAPTDHVVINEIMADPGGPEPAQEWVELVNDGDHEVNLAGWRIEDGTGEGSTLPAVWIRPREFVILVHQDYEPDPDLDAVPPRGVTLLRLPQLGKSGLSNSGELVRLRSADGTVVSKFPQNPKPEDGRSVARRHPHTPFQSVDGFGVHGPSASSPGSGNELRSD